MQGRTVVFSTIDLLTPVVIDNGSYMMKTGLAGQEEPCVFPSVIGESHTNPFIAAIGEIHSQSVIGFEALKRSRLGMHLALEHPLRKGVITNWNAMEEVQTITAR